MNFEDIVESLDESTVLTKGLVLDLFRKFGTPVEALSVETPGSSPPASWRERIWICPDETQITVKEFAEAANRKRSWAYERVQDRTAAPVHFDEAGRPFFVALEVREWLRRRGEAMLSEQRRAA